MSVRDRRGPGKFASHLSFQVLGLDISAIIAEVAARELKAPFLVDDENGPLLLHASSTLHPFFRSRG